MLQHDSNCRTCGQESADRLSHVLFECNSWHSERAKWLTHLENDLDLSNEMDSKLLKILKESTKPVEERMCSTEVIKMVAFGGHTAQSRDGVFVVSREDKRRLYVSDILSQRTADFLMTVYNKLSKSRQRELPESKHVTDRPNSRPAE